MLGMRHRLRDERGSVLMIFAVAVPVFILFLAIALNVGDWYTHRRQLQNRADAGALAAGVAYQQSWKACVLGAAGIGDQIANQARAYAGDSSYGGTLYNLNPTNQSAISVAINSSSYGGAYKADGGDPCFKHPADAADYVSPNGGYWTDVRVRESNIPTIFGGFGITLPQITAHARVEIHPAKSDNGFIPLGVPDPQIDRAQARIINECDGSLVKKVDLAPLLDANQTLSGQGVTLWGPTGSFTSPPTPVSPQPIAFTLPSGATCKGGGADGNGYIPLGIEVRVAGKVDTTPDINGPTCSDLFNNTKYADCWTDLTEIRDWKDGDANTGPPVFRNVHHFNAVPTCQYDPYFTRVAACSLAANVDVQWGDPLLGGRPGNYGAPGVTYTVTLNGASLTPVGAKNGIWSVGSTGYYGTSLPGGGPSDVTLNWSWADTNSTDSFRGNQCTSTGGNPCKGSGSEPVHRTFTATDTNAGIVSLAQVTNGPGIGTGASLYDSGNVNTAVSVYLTIGLKASYSQQAPGSQLVTLRSSTPQGSQEINCNTKDQGDDFQEFAAGCTTWFGPNRFTDAAWWGGTPPGCPTSTWIWSQLGTNSPTSPFLCAPTAPGIANGPFACAIAKRTGNAPTAGPNNCSPGDLTCLHPNRYAEFVAGTDTLPDPRIVKIFDVPYGAFKGITGASDAAVPVLLVGSFYITGWGGPAGKDDPCARPPDDLAQPGEVVGRFIQLTEINNGPVDTTVSCDPNLPIPCRAVLVR